MCGMVRSTCIYVLMWIRRAVSKSLLPVDYKIQSFSVVLTYNILVNVAQEYLSGMGIVHRDLACRNILIDENKILKISDFGLSRLVPEDEVYTLSSYSRLPLRWMAPESIFHRQFNSASDVWSFGIVLWEICTMGKIKCSFTSIQCNLGFPNTSIEGLRGKVD